MEIPEDIASDVPKCAEWLKVELKAGPKNVHDIRINGYAAGFTAKIIFFAGKSLAVVVTREARKTVWALRSDGARSAKPKKIKAGRI